MARFVWRSFILMVIFIAGLLVGNIFAPRQILQEKDFVSIVKVQTSLDLEKEDNFATLSQSQSIKEVYISFLRQNYQKAKLEYEYQLINIKNNPQDQKDFIKAKKNYLAIVSYIEQNYPVIQEEDIPAVEEIMTEESISKQTETLTQEQTEQLQTEEEPVLTPQATQTETI
ncbi:MAG: hypothetical protein IKP23_06145 [Elusimicrobiaceae bacterium]|nr:hypothetical protein [Elusimicrobiaceae bacterium]